MRTKYLCEQPTQTPFGIVYDSGMITILISSKRLYYPLRAQVKDAFGLTDRTPNDKLLRRRFVMQYSDVDMGQVAAGIACLQNMGWTVTPVRSLVEIVR